MSFSADDERKVTEAVFSILEQYTTPKTLTLAIAKKMAEAAETAAKAMGLPIVFAVVDDSGHLILNQRMDNALLVSIGLAADKAYTAAALRMPTHELAQACLPGKPFYGLQHQPRMVIVGGGLPCLHNGKLMGAIGVSGGSVEQDMYIALQALEIFTKGT